SFQGQVVGFISELSVYQIQTNTQTIADLNALIQRLNSSKPPPLTGVAKNFAMAFPQSPSASTDLDNLILTTQDASLGQAYSSVGVQSSWRLLREVNPSSASACQGRVNAYCQVTLGII